MAESAAPPARPSRVAPSVFLISAAFAAIAVAATALAEGVSLTTERPDALVLCVVLVALVVAGLLNLEYYYRGQTDAFDHFEAALVPAIFFLPPLYVVGLAAVAKAICQVQRRIQSYKAVFNVAQWSAAAGVGAVIFHGLERTSSGPELLHLGVGAAGVVLVNTAAMFVGFALVQRPERGLRVPVGAAMLLRSTTGTAVVNITFGVLFVVIVMAERWVSPLLFVPLALLHWASRGQALVRAEQTRLRTTRQAVSALNVGAHDEPALSDFLTAIGTGLDRERAELVELSGDAVHVRTWRRGLGMSPPAETSLDDTGDLIRALLDEVEPVRIDANRGDPELRRLLRTEGERDCAAAPLGVGRPPGGVLVLYGARSAVALPDVELALVGELAREVGLARERAALLEAVLEERSKMSQIVLGSRDGIFTIGADGTVHTWNPAVERISGHPASEMVDSRRLDVLEPLDEGGQPVDLTAWAAESEDPPHDVSIRTRDGGRRWLACTYARGADSAGEPDRLIVTVRDVTELKQVQGRLADQTAVLELIAAGEPVERTLRVLADNVARIDDDTSCAVLLTSRTDVLRLDVAAASGIDPDAVRDLDGVRISGTAGWPGRAVFERRMIVVQDVETDPEWAGLRPAAEAHDIRSCSAVPIRAPDGDRLLGVMAVFGRHPRPAVERGKQELLDRAAHLAAVAVARSDYEARLAHQATHDALTGLPNRAVLLQRAQRVLQSLEPGAVVVMLFVDLDRFKLVNDSMGHEAGDTVLVEIARRLRRVVRPDDTVARFGGDEFTILCQGGPDTSFLLDLASRVQAVFARPVILDRNKVIVSASVGLAIGTSETDADGLVNEADAAMYRAKERGGNRYELYDASMRAPALLHLVTHSALHHALDHGELELTYQPFVSLRTGELVGAEALLRWQHPERGLLQADEFLPLAERTGLIVPIGEFVVAEACRQAYAWRELGPGGQPLRVAVNLSARELGQLELPRTVSDALVAAGAAAGSVCFEITESALLYDVDATAVTLRQLKELGVQLAIDDFGTGYAPFTYLRQFPVDGLKIDRSFVVGVDQDGPDRAIVTAVVGLARSLRLWTIGEGVETATQFAILDEIGCDAGQGYFVAPSLPPADIPLIRSVSITVN